MMMPKSAKEVSLPRKVCNFRYTLFSQLRFFVFRFKHASWSTRLASWWGWSRQKVWRTWALLTLRPREPSSGRWVRTTKLSTLITSFFFHWHHRLFFGIPLHTPSLLEIVKLFFKILNTIYSVFGRIHGFLCMKGVQGGHSLFISYFFEIIIFRQHKTLRETKFRICKKGITFHDNVCGAFETWEGWLKDDNYKIFGRQAKNTDEVDKLQQLEMSVRFD